MPTSLKIVVTARRVDGEPYVKGHLHKEEDRPAKPCIGEDFEISWKLGLSSKVKMVWNRQHIVEVQVEVDQKDLNTLLNSDEGWSRAE